MSTCYKNKMRDSLRPFLSFFFLMLFLQRQHFLWSLILQYSVFLQCLPLHQFVAGCLESREQILVLYFLSFYRRRCPRQDRKKTKMPVTNIPFLGIRPSFSFFPPDVLCCGIIYTLATSISFTWKHVQSMLLLLYLRQQLSSCEEDEMGWCVDDVCKERRRRKKKWKNFSMQKRVVRR